MDPHADYRPLFAALDGAEHYTASARAQAQALGLEGSVIALTFVQERLDDVTRSLHRVVAVVESAAAQQRSTAP